MKDSKASGGQGEHGPQVHQESEAHRDAYIAGGDQFVFHANTTVQCSCGIYAAGVCRVCGVPLCSRHGWSVEELFLCGAHRQAAGLGDGERRGEGRFRPRYLHQVAQVFGGELLDREAELAELSEFAASGDDRCPYVWWQGDAWTGKSALMAAFVLNSPPRVHVVSFFVTARFAGQSDRAAFLEAVLGQLSELLGQPTPDALTESVQQTWFLGLLEQAAERCSQDGYRLVLVVDGLDEDRGMPAGGDVYSIAALLPGRPPEGVRIILAGRASPPVPGDVPAWHPLHSPAIVRPLSQSAHAVIMRGDTRRELARLLDGGGLGRELLGLVVTAGGGLAGEDLAALADEPVGEVERVLHTVTGRTFAGRVRQWGVSPGHVFVLAHEELQQAALRSLRSSERIQWRARIHAWAEGYRDRGWPEDTPEYLLRGYLRMLRGADDLDRMVALSTDMVRLDRMLDVSGGDAAALADIRAVQGYIIGQPCPDLAAALRLAYTRRDLVNRNSNIPAQLPAVWAVLGNINRAEALTQSIDDPGERTEALGYLSVAVESTGNAAYAARLLDDAAAASRSILSPLIQGRVLAWLSRLIIRTGNLQRAEEIANSIDPESTWDSYAFIPLAVAWAESGDADRASRIAISCRDISSQAEALEAVAQVFAEADDLSSARLAASNAVTLARSATEPWEQVSALSTAAEAYAGIGDLDRARRLINDAEAIARSAADRSSMNRSLAALATAVAETGDLGRAENMMCSVTGFPLASTLRSWSEAATGSGDLERAEAVARSIADLSQQAPALEYLSATVARTGDLDRAEALADSIVQLPKRASALASVARAAADGGNSSRARLLAEKAEAFARSAATEKWQLAAELASAARVLAETGNVSQARILSENVEAIANSISHESEEASHSMSVLASAAQAAAVSGNPDRAEAMARLIGEEEYRMSVLSGLARTAVEIGDLDRAIRLIGEAEVGLAPYEGRQRPSPMESVAATVAKTGDLDRAAGIARSLTEPSCQASALASVARVAAEAGETRRARMLATEAETIISSIQPDELNWPLQALSIALGRIGEMEKAEVTARSISHPYVQGTALEELAVFTAENGNPVMAESIARSVAIPRAQGDALTRFAQVICDQGNLDKARHILAESLITADPLIAVPVLARIDAKVTDITIEHFAKTQRPLWWTKLDNLRGERTPSGTIANRHIRQGAA